MTASPPTSDRRVVLAVCAAFVAFVALTQSLRSDLPDHGDYGSDANMLNYARAFVVDGLAKLRLSLVFDTRHRAGMEPWLYAHWPSFPALALAALLRVGAPPALGRLFPLVVAATALWAFHRTVERAVADRRVALVATVALALAAPFRLLADSFAYMSYDFACKAWSLYLLTRAASSGERRFRIGAGLAAAATVALSGYEMVPAIAIYAAFVPLALASPAGSRPGPLRRLAPVALGLAAGALAGLGLRVLAYGNAWVAATDLLANARGRVVAAGIPYYGRGYLPELSYRAWSYVPVHIGVAAAVLPFAARSLRRTPSLRWCALLVAGDLGWWVVARGHVHQHVHTIAHVVFGLSFAVGVAVVWVWDRAKSSRAAVPVSLAVAVAAVAAGSNALVSPYFNLQVRTDWADRGRRDFAVIGAAIPAGAVVLLPTGRFEQRPMLFLPAPVVKICSRETARETGARHGSYGRMLAEDDAVRSLAGRDLFLLWNDESDVVSAFARECSAGAEPLVVAGEWRLYRFPCGPAQRPAPGTLRTGPPR